MLKTWLITGIANHILRPHTPLQGRTPWGQLKQLLHNYPLLLRLD